MIEGLPRGSRQDLNTFIWQSSRVLEEKSEAFNIFFFYIYTMEYYSAIKKNSFESVLMRWMKLEPIIQSEVSF